MQLSERVQTGVVLVEDTNATWECGFISPYRFVLPFVAFVLNLWSFLKIMSHERNNIEVIDCRKVKMAAQLCAWKNLFDDDEESSLEEGFFISGVYEEDKIILSVNINK